VAGDATVRITQRRSAAGANPSQRDTLRSLGLRGIGKSVERRQSPALAGMIKAVDHLVEVTDPGSDSAARPAKGSDG
jgi:large subunit ribosomal protein L30